MAGNSAKSTAITLACFAIGMFGLAYAAVPLYNLFCKITGYGGTPQQAIAAPGHYGQRNINIHFNADTDPHLHWDFRPLQKNVALQTGENGLALYEAKNIGNSPITGMATFNVTPEKAGKYFTKIECFCFNNQTLAPGEEVSMPVSFYIDPEIENDPFMQDVYNITLSYTFFQVKEES